MRFTISKKLIAGFLTVTVLFGAAIGVFYYYMNKINSSYSNMIDIRVNILSNVKDIEVLSTQQTNSLRGYLLTANPDFETELHRVNTELNLLINETSILVTRPESKEAVEELKKLNIQFTAKYEELLRIFNENSDQQAALDYFKTEVMPIGMKFAPLTNYLTDQNQEIMTQARNENTALVNDMKEMSIIVSMTLLIISLFTGLLISRNIKRNLSKMTKAIASFASGSSNITQFTPIEVKTNDEIGEIAKSFNEMTKTLQEKSWLETSLTEMATMYQGIHDLDKLAKEFLSKITPMVGASFGVFYVKDGSDKKLFRSIACYAKNGHCKETPNYHLGEGIVGQAALENKVIHLTDLPIGYIKITSGVGVGEPASLLVIPVEFAGEVTVVIELASFKRFEHIQEKLLYQIANHIGITVNSVSGRMQIEKLLKESKQLTEELQSQSEELQLQHEELISMNEKLEEQYKRLEQKTKDLNTTKLELEEKAEQLEMNSNYKSEFLANMSHELRSPLNSLLILAHMLSENEEGNLTNQQVQYAETIYKSGNDLLHLINEILDLSKIESGMIDIIPSEVTLKEICLLAERQFLPLAKQKGLRFSINMDEELPSSIWTDQYRLQQVINNLLSNACKFTENGEVIMHVHKAKLETHPTLSHNDTVLAFSIRDTGIGIPFDKRKLIFQAFQQGDGTTSRKYGGTGLGLSISQEIAQLLGGGIDVESEQGKGSTFTLYLPVYEKNCSTEAGQLIDEAATTLEDLSGNIQLEGTQDSDSLFKGKKILIVDDDMRNIFAITTALEKKQMDIFFAENGRSGIAALQENPDIDLILMDIMMPGMDGYETIHAIRAIPEFQNIPIIALTAKAMKMDKVKCIEAGASDYISKPVFLDQLFSLMKVWLYR
ncbi:hypothetical protein WQ54_11945 [Bacillus sp. SA1-12]|uniref:ATP-binding protein n=1 Tax=Bacillus sp. SA1-12 TaxID=1455638 RepID=UPI00062686FF|nr:ATP-binding protein [Bacillus sp. SA1-12]KKI91996.1 hypothetical protein WQ54_11945 [Bacillus sp. SA1-12]